MMMMMSNGIRNSNNKYNNNPFTPSQWQELEHQALVFKYMASGIPIPPDLLFTIRTSLDHSKLFLHQHPPHLFQMGYGGRKIDPEPGRCRRTDGKKWRCSKEAYLDSKYCERHMHRGRNRSSRKPVENNNNASINLTSTISRSQTSFINYPRLSSSRPPGIGIGLSLQENNFFLESNSHSPAKDFRNRYGRGMKAETGDEHTFFSVNNESRMKNKILYSCDSQSLNDNINSRHQNYYTTYEDDDDQVQQPKKVMHHFLDEWSPKDRDLSWLDSEHHQDNIRTQLSISTPNSMHDFFITTPKW